MADEIPSPAGISLIGAVAVVVFYWLHLAAVNAVSAAPGIEVTLFIAAFLAQFIPLSMIEDRN
jgi:hypothetical protein